MANLIGTFAKGRFAQWCTLSAGSDQLVILLLQSSGLGTDTTLRNCQFISNVLAAGTEATFTNYARKTLTSGVSVTFSTVAFTATIGIGTQTWFAAGGVTNNTIAKCVVGWKPTSAATDAQTLLLGHYDVSSVTTSGSDLIGSWASGNIALAS